MRLPQQVAVTVWAWAVSCEAAQMTFPTVCSAFNARGDAATVTISGGKFMLRVMPGGGGEPISFPTPNGDNIGGALSCRLFFDKASRYVAVGVRQEQQPYLLRVLVADLTANSWISRFTLEPKASGSSYLDLAGFLDGNPVLAVAAPTYGRDSAWTFPFTLFTIAGEQKETLAMQTAPDYAELRWNPNRIDALHNRILFFSTRKSCALLFLPISQGKSEEVEIDGNEARAACDAMSAIAFPDERTVITSATRGNTDPVTVVDLPSRTAHQLVLPQAESGKFTSVDEGSLSPDGRYFAVARTIRSVTFFGNEREYGTEVDVVQVSPLKLIGKVLLNSTAAKKSISIDQRNGAITVLSFNFKSGRWNSERLKVQ